jgi:hypothetical protein
MYRVPLGGGILLANSKYSNFEGFQSGVSPQEDLDDENDSYKIRQNSNLGAGDQAGFYFARSTSRLHSM